MAVTRAVDRIMGGRDEEKGPGVHAESVRQVSVINHYWLCLLIIGGRGLFTLSEVRKRASRTRCGKRGLENY